MPNFLALSKPTRQKVRKQFLGTPSDTLSKKDRSTWQACLMQGCPVCLARTFLLLQDGKESLLSLLVCLGS